MRPSATESNSVESLGRKLMKDAYDPDGKNDDTLLRKIKDLNKEREMRLPARLVQYLQDN